MIPYGRQEISDEDIDAVVKVLHSDYLTQGPVVPLFEKKLCSYTGANYAVGVNSCTSALHIACLALGLGAGDILWTSPITFVASANCALYCGATVDFVDIEPDTGLMSVDSLKDKLVEAEKKGTLPKIVIPVHFAGQPCDMEEIYKLGQEYGFKIIEDGAHAIGASYQKKPIGSCQYSDITVFSFHPVKIITTGEGGAALTNDEELADRMSLLRSHGITRDPKKMIKEPDGPWAYEQIDLGFNYRLTDLQAALGVSQLIHLDKFIARRADIAITYDLSFKMAAVEPLARKNDRTSSYHLYVVKAEKGIRDKLYKCLREFGVGVNVHYIPVYKQPYFNMKRILPESEAYYQTALSLPIYFGLSKDIQKDVIQKVFVSLEKCNYE